MPAWGPVKRRDLIAGLRALGFEGPFSGGVALLALILRQGGITRKDSAFALRATADKSNLRPPA